MNDDIILFLAEVTLAALAGATLVALFVFA